MAYQKLQASSSFAPIPSDTVDIPNPTTLVTSGTTTSAVTGSLVDTGKDFVALGVLSGAIVYNTASGSEDAAYVTAFKTATNPNDTLVLSKDIMGSTETYTIYNEATKGAVLYAVFLILYFGCVFALSSWILCLSGWIFLYHRFNSSIYERPVSY